MYMVLTVSNEVGMVGATSGYESFYTNFGLERRQSLTSYRQVRNLLLQDQESRTYGHFPPFPNYHIRTTGFMMARDVMLKLKVRRLCTKMDCLRLESGKNSITRQILRMGLKPLLVGRDGRAYEKEEWFQSATFR